MDTGDDRDFCEYVMARQMTLRRSAFLLCRDVDQADDLVQTAITKLYLHWSRAARANSLDAYTYTILVRVFLDEQRRGWWRVRLMDRAPDRAAEQVDDAARLSVRDALALLKPRHRAVLVLRYYQDLTIEQTAEALRCSPGTVKSQTHRALDALRAVLSEGTGSGTVPVPAGLTSWVEAPAISAGIRPHAR